MKVADCMTAQVIAVSPEESGAVAARLMTRHNVGALPVRDRDGSLCGMLTDRDLVTRCMAINRPAEGISVDQLMTLRVAAVTPETSLEQAAAVMAREQVRRLPVLEGRRLVGLVSLGDLARQGETLARSAQTLREITETVHHLE